VSNRRAVVAALTIVAGLGLAGLGAAAASATPARSLRHAAASARAGTAIGAGAEPVPDTSYQFSQLWYMSSNYWQRYSGEDGPPGDLNPADGNRPPRVNGWQEFYQHWKEQVTSPKVMGPFAKDLHVDDHLFKQSSASFFGPPPPYDDDVRTVTIPGSTCPGQTVVIAGHPDSTLPLNIANGSSYDDTSGITMGMAELQAMTRWWAAHHTWPARTLRLAMFDGEEEGLYGSFYYAGHLIPPGPQGRIVLVVNMDQNGMEYPAHPAGSTHTTFGPGFWYTNINASPLKDFSIYGGRRGGGGPPPPAFKRNWAAIKHFRAALAQSVAKAFATLGKKYHYRVPLENPLEAGATVPAYRPSDLRKFSPVQDDTVGRTDQVPFLERGIPGYGVLGAYDSNPQDDPLAYPPTPLTPIGAAGLPQVAGYDTPRDNMIHLNLMTSGTIGGADGSIEPTELRRALELPMTWTVDLIARPEYVGGVPAPSAPVAYFEALPTTASPGSAVTFNGADTAAHGQRLRYVWSFGDGSGAAGAVVHHRYRKGGWYLAKLAVGTRTGAVSGYEQVVQVGSPGGKKPAADPCGRMSRSAALRLLGRHAKAPRGVPLPPAHSPSGSAGGRTLARTGSSPVLPWVAVLFLGLAVTTAAVRARQ
jgi:hypothetical protein